MIIRSYEEGLLGGGSDEAGEAGRIDGAALSSEALDVAA